MANIAVLKSRDGIEYVYLKESYRVNGKVKTRTLKSYGRLDNLVAEEPGIVERLKSEAKAGTLAGFEKENMNISHDLTTPISFIQKNYGWKLLDDVYKMLNIQPVLKKIERKSSYDLDKILRLLVFGRILNPQSKLKTVENKSLLWGDWHLKEHHVYRSLKHFNQVKDEIQLAAHQSIVKYIGREAMLVFYDVTNYYFEIDLEDEDIVDEETGEIIEEGLRKRGPSKERRPKPIVQLGLFMDTNGIPISYKLFRGNQVDSITYLPAIEQVKKQFGLERILVVADKAMNSAGNVTQTRDNGDGWLFSQKHRGSRGVDKVIQEFALDTSGWEYNEKLTKAKKSMIRKRKLNDGTTAEEKVVVTWNKKYADREQIRRDGALEYIEGLTNPERFRASCKRGGKKYIEMYELDKKTGERKPLSPFLDIDYEKVDFDAQFDGINILVTSEIELSDEVIIDHYHELSKIEDCFRVTKTEFDTRPVYVSLKAHIEAHFLTCFLGLIIIRVLQNATEWQLSPRRIVDALNSATTSELGKGYEYVQANQDMIMINRALKIDWELAYVKSEKLSTYASGYVTTYFKAIKNR
jgi:transposase